MNESIGLVFNAYREENALPGLLENASQFFDEIVMVYAPPGDQPIGVPPKGVEDGTVDIAKEWGARVEFDTIEEGFGALRSRCIRQSSCEWVMIMDCDERIHWHAPLITCEGDERWDPNTCPNPKLEVKREGGHLYDQGKLLRSVINTYKNADAVMFSRRHWFDFSWERPTQNWNKIADWQLRCVRNIPEISYTRGMHESVVDSRKGDMPNAVQFEQEANQALYFDHYHLWFKDMEKEQRQEDIETYDRLHQKIDMSDHPQEPGV